jgi:hypothetical protein
MQSWFVGSYGGYANAEVDRIAEENLSMFDPKLRLEKASSGAGGR